MGSLSPSLVSREISTSSKIFYPQHPLPQHFVLKLRQCEFHHHISSYLDTHRIYAQFFHRQSISLHLLCLFLFLWLEEKYFYQYTTSPVSFLVSQIEFEFLRLFFRLLSYVLGNFLASALTSTSASLTLLSAQLLFSF
jgi:hypothetical protein